MALTPEIIEAANRSGERTKKAFPAAVGVKYDRRLSKIMISLESGLILAFAPKDAQGLENASPEDLEGAVISPSGLGVHFPQIDADLFVPGLLEGFMGSKNWMAAQMGKVGGKAKTEAKSAAARENGKAGGRPKKVLDHA